VTIFYKECTPSPGVWLSKILSFQVDAMTSGTVSNPQAGNNKSPVSEADDHDNLPEYQFITFQDPHTLRSRGTQRLIRSHGVRKSLQTRRKKLLQANENFRAVEFTQTQPSPAGKLLSPRTSSIAINELDPFESLAVNSLRLQTLINHSMSRSKSEIRADARV